MANARITKGKVDDGLLLALIVHTTMRPEDVDGKSAIEIKADISGRGWDISEIENTAEHAKVYFDKKEKNEKLQLERANTVLAMLNAVPSNESDGTDLLTYVKDLDDVISKNLDHFSIWEFVQLVCKNHDALNAKARASIAHLENRAMKASTFDWCDKHFEEHKKIDRAAAALAGKIVPVTFRTAQKWISEWKKLQSASKP